MSWRPSINQRWFCVADAAAGFSVNDQKKWVSTDFDVKANRYLLDRGSDGRLHFTKVGDEFGLYCLEPAGSIVQCGSTGGVTLNIETRRYLKWYNYGFYDGIDTDANTPYVEIGVCSRL